MTELHTQLRRTVVLAVAVCCLALTPDPAVAQPTSVDSDPGPNVTLVLEGQQRSRYRLAYPEPSGLAALTGEAAEAGREVDEVLRRDLTLSGVFELQGPAELSILTLSGDAAGDREQYRSLGNELLLLVNLSEEPGKLVIEGRVVALESGEEILGKRYRGAFSSRRRLAHTLANAIIEQFSGRKSLALTSIAFYSDRQGSGVKEIYLMDYDGANQRPISAHKTLSLSPDWSPTGDAIAYVSYFGGQPGIYLADLATGRKSPVITEGNLNISPSFSPDGSRIAFTRSLGGGNTEIFSCNRDGSDLRRLTQANGIDTNPAWSPTGREIAFTSSRSGTPQIYLMDAEGANLRRLSFTGDYSDGAAWSPDGTRIAYATRRGNAFDVAVTDVVTGETRKLTGPPGSHESPTFSPDGRRIAFASRGPDGSTQIYTVQLDGTGLTRLTTEGSNFAPSWSGY